MPLGFSKEDTLDLFVLILLIVMYLGIILLPSKKAWISMGASVVLILGGAVTPAHAFGSLVNWNILLIYLGSLILAELFIYSRVPAFIAQRIVERSPSIGIAITIILFLTGLLSAFVENVATVLVIAPIMIELAKRGKRNLAPLMIGLAVMANLQGTATLVGDPPSMLFANFAGYSFNDFFFKSGKPSIFFAIQIGAIVGALYFYFYFRKTDSDIKVLPPEGIVAWFPSVLLLSMIGGLALFSALSAQGGIHPASGIFWMTLVFLIGIFIVVGALAESSLLNQLAEQLAQWVKGDIFLGFALIVAISVLISGFVDNVPYIAAMLPVANALANAMQIQPDLLMFGLLIGSCLGGNLTPFGASANIVAVGLSEKHGCKVSFWRWIKLAGPFTIITTIAASAFVWLVWA